MCYLMFNESIIKQNVTENVEFYHYLIFLKTARLFVNSPNIYTTVTQVIVKCVDFACDLSECFYLFQNNQIMYFINSPCDVTRTHVLFVYACVCVLVICLIAFKLAKATFFFLILFFFLLIPLI